MFYVINRLFSTRYAIGRATTTKTGSNDARRVVWALGNFLFFRFFNILINVLLYKDWRLQIHDLQTQGSRRRRKRAQTMHEASFGPLVSSFFPFLFVLILTIKNRCYRCIKVTEWVIRAGDDENGPKRRTKRRLGH